MAIKDLRKERNALIKSIKAQIEPFLYESGYRTGKIGESRPLRLWVPRDAKGELTDKTYTLRGGMVLTGFSGFAEHGVIVDSLGHGLLTTEYAALPIEDLARLDGWMKRMLPGLTAWEHSRQEKPAAASQPAEYQGWTNSATFLAHQYLSQEERICDAVAQLFRDDRLNADTLQSLAPVHVNKKEDAPCGLIRGALYLDSWAEGEIDWAEISQDWASELTPKSPRP